MVMVVDRWDMTNLFHAHEDFIQTFSAYLVAGLDPKDTYLVLSDERETGPFGLFWDHIMTDMNGKVLLLENTKLQNPLASTKNLKQFLFSLLPPFPVSNANDGNHIQSHTNICLKRVIFGVHAGISPLSREIGKSSSFSPPTTTLFLTFKDFVLKCLIFPTDDVVNNDRIYADDKIPTEGTFTMYTLSPPYDERDEGDGMCQPALHKLRDVYIKWRNPNITILPLLNHEL
jgi:hypothetical protein